MALDFKNLLKNATNSGMNRMGAGGTPGTPGMMNSGMRPMGVRVRGKQTLGGAIMGVFIGIALILGSPWVLWSAESQHTAKDFQSAQQVEADSGVSGYVTFQGVPTVAAPLECVEGQASCLYAKVENQELKTIQEEQCGQTTSDARVLYSTVMECDEDGANCQQCYQVERDVWTTVNESTQFTDATVGGYTVKFNDTAMMLGLEEKIIEHTTTTRDVWSTFPVPGELRVAGDASNNMVSGAQTTYVLSPYGYEQTMTTLQAGDDANKWMFRIITFLMLFIGYSSIFGPLSYFSHLMRKVPLIGPFIKEGAKMVIGLVSFLLAVATFLVVWGVIALVKNIWVVMAVLILGFAIFFFFLKKGRGEGSVEGPVQPPSQTPPTATPAA